VKTQNTEILKYLKRHTGLTRAKAAELFGAYNLPARILELRQAGNNIQSIWREKTNRYGNTTRYVEYRLCTK
jgi:hypothetical protein